MDTLFRWPMKTFHKGYTRQMNNSWLKRNTRYDDSTPQRVYFHHRRSTLYNLCFLYPTEKTFSPEEQHTSHTGTTHFRRLTLVTGTTLVMSPNLVRRAAKKSPEKSNRHVQLQRDTWKLSCLVSRLLLQKIYWG